MGRKSQILAMVMLSSCGSQESKGPGESTAAELPSQDAVPADLPADLPAEVPAGDTTPPSDSWLERVAVDDDSCGTSAFKMGAELKARDSVTSCNGFFQILVQEDGNVVLYEKRDGETVALWSTQSTTPGARAVFQSDGNFVVYDPQKKPLFHTGTHGHGTAKLMVQDDGNLVLSDNYRALWASRTSRMVGRGLQFPIPIDPDVSVSDAQFLVDLYPIILGRLHDPSGLRGVRERMESQALRREQVVAEFVRSGEFTSNPSLRDKGQFVARAFQTVLKRPASAADIATYQARLRDELGRPPGDMTWLRLIEVLYASAEYKKNSCETSYYTYGEPIKDSALSLRNLFNGKARLPQINESQAIGLDFTGGGVVAIYDQKLPTVKSGNGYLGFTRGDIGNGTYNIFALETTDGITFKNVSGTGIFNRVSSFPSQDGQVHYNDFYDPHVAIDHSTCPPRYIMAMECGLYGETGLPSFCTSYTSTPKLAETWSKPKLVVRGCRVNASDKDCENSARQLSASTGVTLADGKQKYVKWTEVDDGKIDFQGPGGLNPDEGDERSRSKGAKIGDFSSYLSSTKKISSMILDALPDVRCMDEWDCNNRDIQDWKMEDGQFYEIYNGANYFRCERPSAYGLSSMALDAVGTSSWAISVSRSRAAVGGAQQRLPYSKTLKAQRNDTCGVTYPMINAINGELFVYYSYKGSDARNYVVRGPLKPE